MKVECLFILFYEKSTDLVIGLKEKTGEKWNARVNFVYKLEITG